MAVQDGASAHSSNRGTRPWQTLLTIFVVSVVGLLLEMMLIRWIGTEVRIFAYLQNTVLIVCFLGLGMGCFTCQQPVNMGRGLLAFMLLTAMLSIPFARQIAAGITEQLSGLTDFVIWGQADSTGVATIALNVVCGLTLTFGIMLLLWEIFIPMGRLLARSMNEHPNTIQAYSVNVAGSLIGIWLFVGLSACDTSPFVWVTVSAVLLAYFAGTSAERVRNLACLTATVAVAAFAGYEPDAVEVAWSPYQKLTLAPSKDENWPGVNFIFVNNTGYQALIDNSDAAVRADKRVLPESYGLTQYDLPMQFHAAARRVLVVGAGSGNDVAGALRGGAEDVTAVEIDPAIIDFGRRFHPERPYDSEKVHVVNDDARSYFATSDKKFDLIIFGLLDSHTTTALTNARLDHYVYTRESIERARTLLADGGVMVLSFDAMRMYIADRMSHCIEEVFGQQPLAFRITPNARSWGGTVFVAGDQSAIAARVAHDPRLAHLITAWQHENPLKITNSTRVATDDWPYIYLEKPTIPTLYILLAVLLGGLVTYGIHQLGSSGRMVRWQRADWHFFFLGAAFMLLETQNISKAAVVLGNTWLVNAVIVSGIMLMILVSNLVAAKLPRIPKFPVAVCLIGTCVALYFVDISRFAFLPFMTKAIVVGTLTTLPMLFSGLIFIDSFAKARHKDTALGANLMGALIGGGLQSITYIIGIKALLLVVAALYGAALICSPRRSESATEDNASTSETDDSHIESTLYESVTALQKMISDGLKTGNQRASKVSVATPAPERE
jgi:spermidine synthase